MPILWLYKRSAGLIPPSTKHTTMSLMTHILPSPTTTSKPTSHRRPLRERRGFTLSLSQDGESATVEADAKGDGSTRPDRHLASRLAHEGIYAQQNTPNMERLWWGQASWHFVLCAKVALGRKLGGSWSVVGHFVENPQASIYGAPSTPNDTAKQTPNRSLNSLNTPGTALPISNESSTELSKAVMVKCVRPENVCLDTESNSRTRTKAVGTRNPGGEVMTSSIGLRCSITYQDHVDVVDFLIGEECQHSFENMLPAGDSTYAFELDIRQVVVGSFHLETFREITAKQTGRAQS
ncbi:hypothetical protein FB45DRAFT_1086504 [Roridomyces roridus]|uniref:Uncharacterized protein n=1 Tax=Roridomyces roridus TaxID=1738132 RepID=A0AAD7BLS9_9AGAR|nr:hypothetical protein FB45DRAFT_1086504 [Roridomyces roridus]